LTLTRQSLKDLQALRLKKRRLARDRCLVEGARLVSEALRSTADVEQVLVTARFTRSDTGALVEDALRSRELEPTLLTDSQAERLGATQHPQGIFAVVRLPSEPLPPERLFQPPILILDDIADPGNLGTLLRTADWFAIPTVWVSERSADVLNPKVLRGGMGAHFHIPNLWQGDLSDFAQKLPASGITLLGAVLDGRPLSQVSLAGEAWALVVGSEAHGLSPFWRERLDEAVTIPGTGQALRLGSGQAESLNAAVAAGIILHYLRG